MAVKERIHLDNLYKALTVKERIDAFKKAGFELKTDGVFLDRWINIKGLSSIKDTEYLCKAYGITIDEFTYALKDFDIFEKKVLEEDTYKAGWYGLFEKVMDDFEGDDARFEELAGNIAYTVRPFVKYFILRASEVINECQVRISQSALTNIIDWIAGILSNVVAKVVTLDLHNVIEESPDISFEDYLERYSSGEKLYCFYSEYPTMTRLLTMKLDMAVNNFRDMIYALKENEMKIMELSRDTTGIIDSISFGEGDTHSGGKTVTIVTYAKGDKIVYKPKQLKIEREFNGLLEHINNDSKSGLLQMDYCKSIYGDTYTISEFIENEECGSRGEVEDYYKRLGQLLFIIYLLNGNDFHYENIIARGSQVYLIDIETLFQVANVDVISGDDTAEYMISREYADSVLSVGILPLLGFNQNLEGKSVDISALNGKKQKLPYKILQMKNINTTEMIFEYDFGEIGGGGNIPILNGEKQFFMEYAESLIEGFSAMSAYIMKNKCEIRHYISDIFSKPDLVVRQLTKATATYAALLQYFNHPNYLRDMIYMERLFENLMSYPYADKRIVPYEIADMLNGDIPIFFSKLNDRNLLASDMSIIDEYLSVQPLDRVLQKIDEMDESKLGAQMQMFLSSIGVSRVRIQHRIDEINADTGYAAAEEYKTLKEDVRSFNDNILKQRVFNQKKDDFTWVKYNGVNIRYEPVDSSYMTGIAGVAKYFEQMYRVYGDEEYFRISEILVQKLDKIPLKYYDNNLDQLANLIVFVNSEKLYEKYRNYIRGLGMKLVSKEVMPDDGQKKIFVNLLCTYCKKQGDKELEYILKSLYCDGHISFKDMSVKEVLDCTDTPVWFWLSDEEKKTYIKSIREYGDELISIPATECWRETKNDCYSGGMLFTVNTLIDIYELTGDDKYLVYARGLMAKSMEAFKKEGEFRIYSDMDNVNVSLAEGLSGISYTLLRTFNDDYMPDIYSLKA